MTAQKYYAFDGEYVVTNIDVIYNSYLKRDNYVVDGKVFRYLKDAKAHIETRLANIKK